MSYNIFKSSFMETYDELTAIYKKNILLESALPRQTSEVVNLKTCREIITSKYNKAQGGYETNCVAQVNNQLSRIEVRVFVLKREDGEIKFLGRKVNHGVGYTTPGGGFDLADQTVIKTAERELHEELNITLKNIQESAIHSFYSMPHCTWVSKYVENPSDRWTGYYQYYVTAEYLGDSDNDNPEEFNKFSWLPISIYEGLSDEGSKIALNVIAGHKWSTEEQLEEAFDNEEVYGEAARTIPGVLRYFVEDIHTLNAILARGRIKASTSEESDPETLRGTKSHKYRPFVSFSHQLFSHAYRAPSKWKYGVAVSQEKLETVVKNLAGANIKDGFKHPGKTMFVYGAAKLADGTELLITSFGGFAMNLSDRQRTLLGDLPKTAFYEQVKDIFINYINKKHEDGLSKILSEDPVYIETCIKKRSNLSTNVIEGFLLYERRPSSGMRFTQLYDQVPGLLDYLQDHTPLDEGELRVWLPDGHQWLDIKDCIVGIVLPSNYKEDNYDNLQNTAADVLSLRRRVAANNLTVYVYNSNDESNIPAKDLSKKRQSTLEKKSIADYFYEITSSREAVIDFIRTDLAQFKITAKRVDLCNFYGRAMAKATTSAPLDVIGDEHYCYSAFLDAIAEYGFTKKDVLNIYYNGVPLPNAKVVFDQILASTETVKDFMQQLKQEDSDTIIDFAYNKWFTNNTNAVVGNGQLIPETVNWQAFKSSCKKKFNYLSTDLLAMYRGEYTDSSRETIKAVFRKIALVSKSATLRFIDTLIDGNYGESLNKAYDQYMKRHTLNASSSQYTQCNYQAWLDTINLKFGLSRAEVEEYFKNHYKKNEL